MKRNQLVVVALLLVAAAVALSIFLRDPEPASIDAASQAYPMQGDQPAASWRAGAGRPERPDAGRAALDPLDCATPFGDVARVDGEAITARELCAVWRHVAGAAELGDPTVLQQQGKTLLDAIIDARLVHRALASTGREVAESD